MSRTLDLPRLVMRRAALAGLGALALAAGLGLQRVSQDMEGEMDAAQGLALVMAALGPVEGAGQGAPGALSDTDTGTGTRSRAGAGPAADAAATADAQLLQRLQVLTRAHPLRHLSLQLQDEQGRVLLAPSPPEPASAWMEALFAAHRRWLSSPEQTPVRWRLARGPGRAWVVTLSATHDSERREAMSNWLGLLGLLLAGLAGMLAVMQANVRRAFRPLGQLVQAIGRVGEAPVAGRTPVEAADATASGPEATPAPLPPMPIRELEQIAAAVRQLQAALQAADAHRRQLSRSLLGLQEDERTRLARELHDELGQRLTALRVDVSWLARHLAAQPEALAVVESLRRRLAEVHGDIRGLLNRLNPLGLAGDSRTPPTLDQVAALIQALADSWGRSAQPLAVHLRLREGLGGPPLPPGRAAAWPLSHERALALLRLSQEALTNVARHAQARQACLSLALLPDGGLAWSVADDGIGLPPGNGADRAALHRGHGLAGMQERVWALGGQWVTAPTEAVAPDARSDTRSDTGPGIDPDLEPEATAAHWQGLRLSARWPVEELPGP